MKISTKGRYGLRAIIDIAIYGKNGPVSIKDIAVREEISERYLEQLMIPLKKKGLIKSQRGAKGGYILTRELSQISVGEILRALEDGLRPVNCKQIIDDEDCLASDCVMGVVWNRISEAINTAVDNMFLDELIKGYDKVHIEGCKL